ncbi:glycosyltransferase family 4 protein [Nautilia lithotrophica]
MKIGYVAVDILPINNAGAVRNTFFIEFLQNEGHEVIVFSSVENEKYNICLNKVKLASNKASIIKRIFKEIIYGIELFFRIIYNKRQDMYVISSPPFIVTLISFLAVKLKKGRIVLDIRDLYPEVLFQNKILNKNSFLGKIFSKIEKYLYDKSEKIITVTDYLRKDINNKTATPVYVIRNGFDEEIFKPISEKFKDFTIVFHGTLGRFQNIELLCKLIEEKKDVKFLVIGDGSKSQLIENLQVENLTYIKKVPYQKIPELISKAHIGISLRTDDFISQSAFPVKIFEYMGVGIPVIVTPKSESGVIIEYYKFGYQCDNDIKQIASCIMKIKESYDLFLENISSNRQLFSRQYQSRKWKEIL